MSINLNDLTLGQLNELKKMLDCSKTVPVSVTAVDAPKQVIVRTYSAGVHIGTLAAQNGKQVTLKNAQRLWSWTGAFTLSEISQVGPKTAKLSIVVPTIDLSEAIEVIEMSSAAIAKIASIPVYVP